MSLKQLLEVLAVQTAADTSFLGTHHGSRIARLKRGTWQVAVLAETSSVVTVTTPEDLRKAMENPEVSIVFLPHSAIMTEEALERICRESALDKTIVWEMDS